ncbi:MAG: heavy metal translocating P-type ATPase [Candidatus Bathyarchaeia archaeon]
MRENHTEKESCPECDAEVLEEEADGKDRRIALIVLSAGLLSTGLIFEFVLKKHLLALVLFLATTGISGYTIAKEGVSSLLRKRVSIDLLITIAAIGAFLIGHGEEGAAVVFLFYLAEYLEGHAAERARRSIHSLMKLAPEIAVVKRKGREERVHVHSVDVNDTVLVRPGEKIPLDGIVKRGVSSVNQAPITGESMPKTKQVGDEVYAGTINNEGFLEIKVTRRSDQTMLSKIVKLVEEAQEKKSPTERFVDRFSRYYTPSVMFLAVGVAIIPTLLLGMPFNEWFYKALVLLVVSCPCALAISTPVAMVSAVTSGARNGVLIKGSNYVEEISRIKVFAFDKTGTLTEGKLEVTDITSFGHPKKEILLKAASLEALSEHPIARAIVEKAEGEGVKLKPVNNFRAVVGKGVMGEIEGEAHYVGSGRMFRELSIDFPEGQTEKLENEGKTVIFVGSEKKVIGLIAVMDKIRDATVQTMAELEKKGIRKEMITGDNERTARAIAKKIGMDEYHAELFPDDKVSMIGEHLAKDYGHVAMVGDGVNDAPALARASVGIAMGAIGSDVSLETADIALMQDDLSKLPYLIELSKKTLEIVKENVLASILIKGSFAILVFPGLVTLWLAVAIGDMGLSLAVILNAMRLSGLKSGSACEEYKKRSMFSQRTRSGLKNRPVF